MAIRTGIPPLGAGVAVAVVGAGGFGGGGVVDVLRRGRLVWILREEEGRWMGNRTCPDPVFTHMPLWWRSAVALGVRCVS
jgi:hypothetical protein